MTTAYAYHEGEAEVRWLGETSTSFLAMGEQTGEEFALVDERARRGETVPLHRHVDDVESFYVLEGEIAFFLDEQPAVRAGAGAFVHVPAGAVHGFRIESDSARYLILTTPQHGRFYRAITVPSGPGGAKPVDADQPDIGRASAEFRIEYVGPLPDQAGVAT